MLTREQGSQVIFKFTSVYEIPFTIWELINYPFPNGKMYLVNTGIKFENYFI